MLTFPAPSDINGGQLADEIAAAGFTDVHVVLVGDVVRVTCAELVDPMPPAEERAACETQEELDALVAAGAASADTTNASAAKQIAPVVAAHIPAPVETLDPVSEFCERNGVSLAELKQALSA